MKKGILLILCGTLLCLSASAGQGYGRVPAETIIDTPYEYPVQPGTPEWNALPDKLGAAQVPEKILKSMSTAALVDTVLSSPFFTTMAAYSYNFRQGFSTLLDRLNCLNELTLREDSAIELLEKLKVLSDNFEENPSPEAVVELYSFMPLLAQPEFTAQMNQEMVDELSEAMKNLLLAYESNGYTEGDFSFYSALRNLMGKTYKSLPEAIINGNKVRKDDENLILELTEGRYIVIRKH